MIITIIIAALSAGLVFGAKELVLRQMRIAASAAFRHGRRAGILLGMNKRQVLEDFVAFLKEKQVLIGTWQEDKADDAIDEYLANQAPFELDSSLPPTAVVDLKDIEPEVHREVTRKTFTLIKRDDDE